MPNNAALHFVPALLFSPLHISRRRFLRFSDNISFGLIFYSRKYDARDTGFAIINISDAFRHECSQRRRITGHALSSIRNFRDVKLEGTPKLLGYLLI